MSSKTPKTSNRANGDATEATTTRSPRGSDERKTFVTTRRQKEMNNRRTARESNGLSKEAVRLSSNHTSTSLRMGSKNNGVPKATDVVASKRTQPTQTSDNKEETENGSTFEDTSDDESMEICSSDGAHSIQLSSSSDDLIPNKPTVQSKEVQNSGKTDSVARPFSPGEVISSLGSANLVTETTLRRLCETPADDKDLLQKMLQGPPPLGSEIVGTHLRSSESLDESEISSVTLTDTNRGEDISEKRGVESSRKNKSLNEGLDEPAVSAMHSSGKESSGIAEEWSLDDGSASLPIKFSIDKKRYIHPPLPPGWEIKVSQTKGRPFYVHPDLGTTWYCPVVLKPKSAPKTNDKFVAEKQSLRATEHPRSEQSHSVESAASNGERRRSHSNIPKTTTSPLSESMSDIVDCFRIEVGGQQNCVLEDGYNGSVSSGFSVQSSETKASSFTEQSRDVGHGHGRSSTSSSPAIPTINQKAERRHIGASRRLSPIHEDGEGSSAESKEPCAEVCRGSVVSRTTQQGRRPGLLHSVGASEPDTSKPCVGSAQSLQILELVRTPVEQRQRSPTRDTESKSRGNSSATPGTNSQQSREIDTKTEFVQPGSAEPPMSDGSGSTHHLGTLDQGRHETCCRQSRTPSPGSVLLGKSQRKSTPSSFSRPPRPYTPMPSTAPARAPTGSPGRTTPLSILLQATSSTPAILGLKVRPTSHPLAPTKLKCNPISIRQAGMAKPVRQPTPPTQTPRNDTSSTGGKGETPTTDDTKQQLVDGTAFDSNFDDEWSTPHSMSQVAVATEEIQSAPSPGPSYLTHIDRDSASPAQSSTKMPSKRLVGKMGSSPPAVWTNSPPNVGEIQKIAPVQQTGSTTKHQVRVARLDTPAARAELSEHREAVTCVVVASSAHRRSSHKPVRLWTSRNPLEAEATVTLDNGKGGSASSCHDTSTFNEDDIIPIIRTTTEAEEPNQGDEIDSGCGMPSDGGSNSMDGSIGLCTTVASTRSGTTQSSAMATKLEDHAQLKPDTTTREANTKHNVDCPGNPPQSPQASPPKPSTLMTGDLMEDRTILHPKDSSKTTSASHCDTRQELKSNNEDTGELFVKSQSQCQEKAEGKAPQASDAEETTSFCLVEETETNTLLACDWESPELSGIGHGNTEESITTPKRLEAPEKEMDKDRRGKDEYQPSSPPNVSLDATMETEDNFQDGFVPASPPGHVPQPASKPGNRSTRGQVATQTLGSIESPPNPRRVRGFSWRILYPPHPICSLQYLDDLLRKQKKRQRSLNRRRLPSAGRWKQGQSRKKSRHH